ncbi:PREDICTED: uncharacterized protein LOC107344281 [Acropora digitifera]|uniref:uncharacterized protein LOC107344281 n=1 Tax=Acropora digitifera TaxID=70779 RepID=UPI00077A87B0|nr:PREDICTED: uncharacterized protein LOC107344281 [Acropora digitifera]
MDRSQKNVDPYLELVVVEILDLSGVTFFDAFKEAPFTFKVDLLNYVLDYPGKYVACLGKVAYLENRRFLPENHPLRSKKKNVPDQKTERRKGDSMKVRNAEKDVQRFKDCWLMESKVDDLPAQKEQLTNAKKETKSQKSNLSAAPFCLSNGDIQLADRRAIKVCVPVGHGWKPGPFFCKKHYLKSPDWKQLAVDGILRYCLRGLLGKSQRQTFFRPLDVIQKVCSDDQVTDSLPVLQKEINETISLHIFHHSVAGIQQFGPVHGWWMYCYERFNSWICHRVKNRQFPEATVWETYRVFDWVHYMVLSGNLPSFDVKSVVENETAKPATNYLLTTQDVRDLNVYCDNMLPLHPTNCNQFFSIERKVHGKSHVWRAQKLDSSGNKHVSSVVLVNYGNTKH